MGSRARNALAAIAPPAGVALLAFLAYYPSLGHYFWEDDFVWIEDNRAALLNPGVLFKVQPNFRPLCRLFFSLCYTLSGPNPAVYYFLAVTIHAAAGVAVYFALSRLLKDRRIGLAAAALFTVTNTHSDAVFWLVANCGSLGLLFFALALLAWSYYREKKTSLFYWLSAACMVLALFSKEDAMTYPVLLVLTDVLLGTQKGIRLKDRVKEYVPFAVITTAFVLFEVYLQISPARHSGSVSGPGLFDFSPLHLFSNQVSAFFYMLLGVKALDPAPSLLAMSAAVAAAVAACAWLAGTRRVVWAALWAMIAFLPMCYYAWDFYPSVEGSFIRRHLYGPSLGASVLIALILVGVYSKTAAAVPRLRFGIAGILGLAFAFFIAFNFAQVRERSAAWGRRTGLLKAEADAVTRLCPAPALPAGFMLANFCQRPYYEGYMLRMIYNDQRINQYSKWQELEAAPGLKERHVIEIEVAGTPPAGLYAWDMVTGRGVPLDIKGNYK